MSGLHDTYQADARAALLLADDDALRRVVLAWERIPHDGWKPPKTLPPGNAGWDRAWSSRTVDYRAISDASELSEQIVIRKFSTARALRLVYPDGSIGSAAAQMLDAIAGRAMAASQRGRGGGGSTEGAYQPGSRFSVIVDFDDEHGQGGFLQEVEARGLSARLMIS